MVARKRTTFREFTKLMAITSPMFTSAGEVWANAIETNKKFSKYLKGQKLSDVLLGGDQIAEDIMLDGLPPDPHRN